MVHILCIGCSVPNIFIGRTLVNHAETSVDDNFYFFYFFIIKCVYLNCYVTGDYGSCGRVDNGPRWWGSINLNIFFIINVYAYWAQGDMVIAGIINLDIYYIIIIIKLKRSVPLIYEWCSGFYAYRVFVNIKDYRFQ